MWKWLLGIFVLLVLLCGGTGFFFAGTEKGREMAKGFRPGGGGGAEVRIEPVKRGDLVRMVSAPGNIDAKTRVQIGAQVSAKVIALPFREGDDVKKGDVVARLDADDYVAALASAEAGLKADEARVLGLKAELANVRAEFARVSKLFETGDASKQEFDQIQARLLSQESNVRAAEANVDVGQAQITRARKNLEFTTIKSPIDGTITRLNTEVGEQVLGTFNNAGTTLMEIADLSVMVMKARVDEANVAPVRAGQDAKITLNAYPDVVFQGVVDLVGLKRLTERDGTSYFETQILVKLDKGQALPKGDRLRSGYTANADILVETFAGVLKVPSQAVVDRRIDELPKVVTDGNTNIDSSKVFARVVYAVGSDNKTRAVPVSIGTSDTTHTVITAGIAEGDRIIVGPFKALTNLKHDQQVREEGAKPGANGAAAQADKDGGLPKPDTKGGPPSGGKAESVPANAPRPKGS